MYNVHSTFFPQHDALLTQEASGLTTKVKLMPQYLKELGYTSYMVGK